MRRFSPRFDLSFFGAETFHVETPRFGMKRFKAETFHGDAVNLVPLPLSPLQASALFHADRLFFDFTVCISFF